MMLLGEAGVRELRPLWWRWDGLELESTRQGIASRSSNSDRLWFCRTALGSFAFIVEVKVR